MTIRGTAAAITARLTSDSILAGSTFQGVVTDRPTRYVTYFLNGGPRVSNRLTGPSNEIDYTIITHSVGTTAEQAQLVEEHVQAQLIDWTPTVSGQICRRVRMTDSQFIQLDTDVTPPLYYIASTYGLTAESI